MLVFGERDLDVPTEPPVSVALQEPKTAIADPLVPSKVVKRKFLDLRRHPGYEAANPDPKLGPMLPSGVDELVILPAYERILERAETLSKRYCAGKYEAPIRNMIVTGASGIGTRSGLIVLRILINRQEKVAAGTISLSHASLHARRR